MELRTRARKRLDQIAASTGLKPIHHVSGPAGGIVLMEGVGEVQMFASNDYLGLANHPDVVAAAEAALRQFGAGTAGARFICGTTSLHVAFEQELAEFLGLEAALTFSSGFAANVALISTITQPGDVVFSDALNHASLIDGCRMAPPNVRKEVYPHGDHTALERALSIAKDPGSRFILTDGVFSMEGDLARLDDLARLAARYDATLIVDDAHGIGTLGALGAGTMEHFGVRKLVPIVTGSLGKALGGVGGGFVAGPREVIDLLNQAARPQLFSTALPAASIAASREALRLLRRHPEMVSELSAKSAHFRRALERRGLSPLAGITPIVPVILGSATRARDLSRYLLSQGVYSVALAYPTVPEGEARIRFQVSRRHSLSDLEATADTVVRGCRNTEAVSACDAERGG
jgi:glycine C-acetyltransferase